MFSTKKTIAYKTLKITARALLHATKVTLIFGVLLPAVAFAGLQATSLAYTELNLGNDTVLISGTGSMYPTFPKGTSLTIEEQSKEVVSNTGMIRYPRGITLWERDFFRYTIERGDIVAFSNEITSALTLELTGRATSYVKRVMGLPGDTIEIRSGLLYVNDQPQIEPYTARARSTFGGDFLPECTALQVGENQLFVIGDNRTGSNDSRHKIGFISYDDVHNVIPWLEQDTLFGHLWRDPSNDLEDSAVISLDIEKYIKLINQERRTANLSPLKNNPKLSESARLRGLHILKHNDFSNQATASGYTMKKAMQEAGYTNITYGEALVQGYFEAQELLEQQLAFPENKAFLLTPEYQDIGIAAVSGEINGCPTQVIVRHFGGYIPPNYDLEVVASWQSSIERLQEILPSWQNATELGVFYEENRPEIDRIRDIIKERIERQTKIVEKMRANQWLTSDEEYYLNTRDNELANELSILSKKINKRIKQTTD